MKVYIFLADGFEEIEAIAPIDIFRRAGFDTVTVSVMDKKEVTAAHRVIITADAMFEQIDFADADLLFLPGGMPGTLNLNAHEGLKALILQQLNARKAVAAICAAPIILGGLGLLENKEAICYPGFEAQLTGAILSEKSIVRSGLIHTAKGAGVAIDFALALVEEFKNKEAAAQLSSALCR